MTTVRSAYNSSTVNDIKQIIWKSSYISRTPPLNSLPPSLSIPNVVHQTHKSTAPPTLKEKQNSPIQSRMKKTNEEP